VPGWGYGRPVRIVIVRQVSHMTRTAHFGIGLALGLVSAFWCAMGLALWIGNAIGKDSPIAGPFFDPKFVVTLLVWGAILLCILWGMFRSFRRALRPPRLDSINPPPEAAPKPTLESPAAPDERLAHLVKKP
jgi:hypothetical protein